MSESNKIVVQNSLGIVIEEKFIALTKSGGKEVERRNIQSVSFKKVKRVPMVMFSVVGILAIILAATLFNIREFEKEPWFFIVGLIPFILFLAIGLMGRFQLKLSILGEGNMKIAVPEEKKDEGVEIARALRP